MAIELTEKQIQDGWQVVKFGEIAKNISQRVEPSETDLEVYVGLEHLDPQSLKITRRGVPSDVTGQKLRVKPGQIIFGKRRAYQKKVAVADFDGICSAHAMVLEAIPGKIIPELLPFLMQSDMFMDRAVAISEGSLSPTIKWKTLAIQEFPLPPKERQKEILEVLEKVEECERNYNNAIFSLSSVISKALISQFEEHRYTLVKLNEVADVKTGKNSAIDKSLSSGVKMLTLPCIDKDCNFNIIESELALIKEEFVKQSDYVQENNILFNWRNGSQDHIGKVAFIDRDMSYVHVGFLLRICALDKKILPKYLYWYLRYLKLSGFFLGAKQQVNRTFNKGELLELDIRRFSPDTESKIAQFLNGLEQQQISINNAFSSFLKMKNSITQKMLFEGAE